LVEEKEREEKRKLVDEIMEMDNQRKQLEA